MSVPPQGKKCDPEVRRLCGDAPQTQLRCPECNKFAIKGRKYSKDEDWSVLLYCACSIEWVICSKCTGHRTRMRKTQQYHFHKHSKHGAASREDSSPKKKTKTSVPENDTETEEAEAAATTESDPPLLDAVAEATATVQERPAHTSNNTEGHITIWNTTKAIWEVDCCSEESKKKMLLSGFKKPSTPTDVQTEYSSSASFASLFFGTRASSDFFWEEHKQSRGGVRSIVAKSEFGITSMSNDIDTRDVQYSTEVAHFCHGLSRGQRDHFASIMKMTMEKMDRDRATQNTKPWKVAIPCSSLHIRRHITEYPNAYLSLIPTTDVTTLPGFGSFAYIRLRDCVQNFLAYGFTLDTVPNLMINLPPKVTRVVESAYCRKRYDEILKLYSHEVLVLWLVEWWDGYDPHGFSKTNRGSAWVKVVTFVPPANHQNNVGYTYPLALGPSTGDHDIVERRFRDELLALSDPGNNNNVFYSGLHKKFVRVHVELLVSLMDQPERRAANYLTRGNSKFGARWGYSISLESVKDVLVPCSNCSTKLLRGDLEWNKTPCEACAQWDMDSDPKKLKWKCVPTFPLEECNGGEGYLLPLWLTYKGLQEAVRKTEEKNIWVVVQNACSCVPIILWAELHSD